MNDQQVDMRIFATAMGTSSRQCFCPNTRSSHNEHANPEMCEIA